MLRRLTTRAGAGLLVGLALTVLVAEPALERLPPPARNLDPDPADAGIDLVDAWERSRTATYVVVAEFRRSRDGRAAPLAETRTAQRPPDRMVVGGGSARGRLDGRRVACAAGPEGELSCRTGERLGSYGAAVGREVERLEGYVLGPDRIYDVTRDGECFALRLRSGTGLTNPPYGQWALLCFDAPTGALTGSEVWRGDVIDITTALSVSASVTDADLAPAQP